MDYYFNIKDKVNLLFIDKAKKVQVVTTAEKYINQV